MSYFRPIRLCLSLAALAETPLWAQIEAASSPTPRAAPYSCADTSLRRWLLADTASDRSQGDARALYEHHLALTYAPILRFAPSERYFPTIPYWTAFRERDPTMPPLSEIRGTQGGDGRAVALPLISAVRSAYDSAVDLSRRPYTLRVPIPVVFYRVCDFTDPDAGDTSKAEVERHWSRKADYLWSYLRSDEQAWHRFGLNNRPADTTLGSNATASSGGGSLIREIKRFHVIQFFVYYLQDWGLQGHSEDIEYAFVFVPADTTLAKSFRVVVGAGHDPPAPNNVLVLVGKEASKRRYYHPNILVELGGHSSAPDVPPFGQFSAGLDVNWHIDDLWGTRDEQATAGLSFSGRYEGTMTYPRDPEDAVTMFPRGLGAGSDTGRQVLADLVRVSPDYLAERAHEASHQSNPPSAERRQLAEAILAAHRNVLEVTEAPRRDAIRRSQALQEVEQSFPDQTTMDYAIEKGRALVEDSLARRDSLEGIRRSRHGMLVARVEILLREAPCQPPSRPKVQAGCPSWLSEDSLAKVRAAVVELVETGSRRIPADSLMAQLLKRLPDPNPATSALDAITTEIRGVVTERMQPEYTLVPILYLQALYQSAADSNVAQVERHLKLITRLLHPATCEELACGLHLKRGEEFQKEFGQVVCGRQDSTARDSGSVHWPHSLACTLDPGLVEAIRLWDLDVYDKRGDGFGTSRQWPARKHKIWEHELYRRPELIFRTWLFRPTFLQVSNSRKSFMELFHTGYTLGFGRASNPYLGFVIPAFRSVDVPVKVPGYLAVQVGPYFGWPWSSGKTSVAASILYDREFAYFYGLYLKGQWANRRSEVENDSGASEFSWTLGASIWLPFARTLHFRPGFRFDTDHLRPTLDRAIWELQVEYRR